VNPFDLFHAVFGVTFDQAVLIAAGWGVFIGAYCWTFNIDPVASVRRALRR